MTTLFLLSVGVCVAVLVVLANRMGYWAGRREERAAAIDTLHRYSSEVRWSDSVLACIRLLRGTDTIRELKAERERDDH